MLVLSYTRFSKTTQAKGHSTERQKTEADRLAERMGWTIDESRSFADPGMSAFRSKHAKEGKFAGFLAAVKAGVIAPGTILIVEHLDRLSRDKVRVARDQFEALLDAGIEIVTTSPERHYTRADLDDVIGMLEPLLIMARAHEESAKKSDRLRKRFAADRIKYSENKTPKKGRFPCWLTLDGGKYRVNENKADAVRLIYQLAIDGHGIGSIVRRLNTTGIMNIAKPRKGIYKPWNTTNVADILKNEAVKGVFKPGQMVDGKRVIGNPIPDYFPRIVSDEMFYRAQGSKLSRTNSGVEKFKGRGGRIGASVGNLFSGYIFDQHGSTLTTWTRSRGHKHRYISPSSARAKRAAPFVSFPYEKLEGAILLVITGLSPADMSDNETKNELEGMEGERDVLAGEIEEISNRLKVRYNSTLADVLDDKTDRHKEVLAKIESVKTKATSTELDETKKLIMPLWLKEVPADELPDVRRMLKAMLPKIVQRVEVIFTRGKGRSVDAEVIVRFHKGPAAVVHLNSRSDMEKVYGEIEKMFGN